MIILMGVVGAGKSMQGRLLAEDQGFDWISTGELFRALVTGKRREQMLAGKLLSDEEVISLVDETVRKLGRDKEFILDGFPRTTVQTDWLLDQIRQGNMKLTAVLNLVVPLEVVKERLLDRGREDDTEEVIAKRFAEYEANTRPILDYLKERGVTVDDIDGAREPAVIHQDILSRLGKK